MSIALPTPILRTRPNGKIIEKLSIGKQNFSGVWNERIKNFVKFKINHENVRFEDEANDRAIEIRDFSLTGNLKELGSRVTGPMELNLKKISLGSINQAQVLIGHIRVFTDQTDMAFPSLGKQSGLLNFQNYGEFVLKAAINDIDSFADFGSATLEYRLEKIDTEILDQSFQFGYRGLDRKKIKKDSIDLLPQQVEIDLDLNSLPYRDLSLALQQKFRNQQLTAVELFNFVKSLSLLPSKMARFGTSLRISDLNMRNNFYDIEIDSNLRASDRSPLATTGTLDINAKGVNKAYEIIRRELKRDDLSSPYKNTLMSFSKQINLMNSFCDYNEKQETHLCEITLDENGVININNKSVGDFLSILLQ
ncbi:MAG: hypothetical protein AAF549_08835 [Pseudomonadota bacterium]